MSYGQSMTDRHEQTVLTTGANSGIGLATVVHLAKLGFRSVGSVRSEAKATEVAEAAEKAGTKVSTVLLDVTDAERCASVVEELRPWGIVNNAGYSGMGAIEDTTDEEARRQLETMVVAPMRLARSALPHMRGRCWASRERLVDLRVDHHAIQWLVPSLQARTQAASDALRLEVARDGIKVVLIEPGGFKTGIWDEIDEDIARNAGSSYEVGYQRTRALLKLFMGFMGEPEGGARAIGKALTARSPRARYLVGHDAQAITAAQPLIPTVIRDRVTRLVTGL